ncbi:MAG: SGNH/GDSL hydrolase family protein [Sphingobacteriales bacterium]
MKKVVAAVILTISIFTIVGCMTGKKKKVIFFGDSITQLGVEPGGYIDLMNKILAEKNKSENFELIGSGISGNKVYDLYLRLEEDVLAKKPDIVVIWIGVNDVWHKLSMGTGTDADKFAKFYTAIIKKLQTQNISVLLATPAVIGEKYDNSNQQDEDLDLYSTIIRQLAMQYKCGLCDLRKLFMYYEQQNNKENKIFGMLTNDGVHLNAKGNELVAETMFNFITK